MPVFAAANNQVMVAESSNSMTMKTDPIPVGGANFAEVILNIHAIWSYGGGTATLAWAMEGGNDGTTFVPISGFGGSETTSGPMDAGDDVTFAFLRVSFTFSIAGGSAGNWGTTAFDFHVNLIHK